MMLACRLRLAKLGFFGAVAILSIALCAPLAGAKVEFEFEKSFGPAGPGVEGFASVTSVAVDQSERRVYVLDRKADALYKFDFAGNPVDFGGSNPDVSGNKLSGFSIADLNPGARQVAVDPATHTIYLPDKDDAEEFGGTVLKAFQADGDPAEFTAGPASGTNEIPGFHGLRGLAVDLKGNLYLIEYGVPFVREGRFSVYKPSGAVLVSDPGQLVLGGENAAVDSNGTLYIQYSGGTGRFVPSVYPVSPETTYSSQGKVAAKPALSLAVDPTFDQLLVGEKFNEAGKTIARVSVFDQDGTVEGSFGEGELTKPYGIAAGTENEATKAFVANNPEGGPAQVRIFNEELIVAAPTIESISANTVTGDSAKLRARINPNNAETTFVFEYGPEDCAVAIEPCTQIPIGGASIGKGRRGVVVEQALTGLAPQSTYHYRVVATNAKGIKASLDKTFTTQGSGLGFGLGDERVWEMVSPPNKFGGTLFTSEQVVIQASESGDRLAYASRGSIVGEPEGGRLPEPATVLSNRLESGEWLTRDLTPPHTLATQLQPHTEFNLFSPDLGRAEMEPVDATPLSSESSEQTPYLWSDGAPPLFTPMLTAANVPPGTEFGRKPGELKNPVRIEGATPDLESVVVRSSKVPLTEDGSTGLYLWEDGVLDFISELPASEGGGDVAGAMGSSGGSVRNAISENGSRVFWAPGSYNAAGINLTALYLWDREAGESVRLDVKQAGASGTGAKLPAFNAASADGRVAFFTDSQRLTKDASTVGRDLYRCEVGPVTGGLGCATLTDISAPIKGSGESAEVLDQAPAISEDGTRLYFVARGVLDPEPNDQGATAQKGKPNLYLFEEGAGVRFIAALAEEDNLVWGGAPTLPNKLGFAVQISAAASPSGRFLSFTSEQPLTGNDNEDPGGARNTEAYLYDAEANGGQLSCLSCNPTGGSAVGELLPTSAPQLFPPDPGGLWEGRRVAATLPQATHTEAETGRSLYRPRSVLDNGRAFFNSVDPLVAADSNGNWDVYQYQPIGVGSCAAQTNSAAAVRSGPGCVSLISSGTAEGDAGFLDATPSGNDVFFLTKGRLSVLDTDKDLDAYDARVNGIEAVLHPPRECVGEACQPSVPPPNDPTPSSESFRGAETPLNCRKGQRKVTRNGRAVCKPKKKQKKNKHKKKAGKSGRAQR